MTSRKPAFMFVPTQTDEAKGVTINRVIGGERIAILDPMILLDHASIAAGSEVVGFPRHPHRGIETLSYVIEGEVGHKDSIGNEGIVGPGGSQWMTAGNGIWHEEMLKPSEHGAEMLQLWFSLPRDQKRIKPGYQGGPSESIPVHESEGAVVRVVAGSFEGVAGFFNGIAVKPTVLDVTLSANATLEIPTNTGEAAFLYVIRGTAILEDDLEPHTKSAPAPRAIMLTDGDVVSIKGGAEGARFLFVAAKPLNEPILQYRSFVMNTPEDIHETLDLIHQGVFGTLDGN